MISLLFLILAGGLAICQAEGSTKQQNCDKNRPPVNAAQAILAKREQRPNIPPLNIPENKDFPLIPVDQSNTYQDSMVVHKLDSQSESGVRIEFDYRPSFENHLDPRAVGAALPASLPHQARTIENNALAADKECASQETIDLLLADYAIAQTISLYNNFAKKQQEKREQQAQQFSKDLKFLVEEAKKTKTYKTTPIKKVTEDEATNLIVNAFTCLKNSMNRFAKNADLATFNQDMPTLEAIGSVLSLAKQCRLTTKQKESDNLLDDASFEFYNSDNSNSSTPATSPRQQSNEDASNNPIEITFGDDSDNE